LAHINGRWPYFVPVALVAGYHSVHALPVRLRQQVIGTLSLFRADTGTLNAKDVLVAQAIADATAIAILQQRALQDAHLLADQLQKALHSRIPIEQAKGVLAERAKLSVSDALIHIRSYARNHNQQLTSVCRRVIDGTLSVSDLVERPRA
jgi:GAF domain-containing protein